MSILSRLIRASMHAISPVREHPEKFNTAETLLLDRKFTEFNDFLRSHPALASFVSPKNGGSLLHIAVCSNDLSSVATLIDLHTEVDLADKENRTSLMEAVRSHSDPSIISLLLEAGAKASYSTQNRSVINYASRGVEGNLPILQLLLASLTDDEAAAAVNFILTDTAPHKTALDYAQNPDIRRILIKHGAISGGEYCACLRNDTELRKVAETLKTCTKGYKPKYPCIMLPGTCSSVLECWKSESKPQWVGSRIWLDPSKLGLKLGFSHKNAEDVAFLEHMRLEADGISDPPGICVRPAEGLHGIDYLMDGGPTIIVKQSVVWGEFISVLASLGYDSTNLVGFPYDWRLAPEAMQQRDKICLKLKYVVEFLCESNEERVVLIGHSQGCKFGQFFLHWAEEALGREWIDKHVQSFIAMGPPWAGAPKLVRGMVSGDSMGLPTSFLFGNRYMIALVRALSGSLWLLPRCKTYYYYKEGDDYQKKDWEDVLPEMCENHNNFMEKFYGAQGSNHLFTSEDENMRSLQAPYVANLHCVYGINSKEIPNYAGEAGTEVGAYFVPREPIVVGSSTISMKLDHKLNDERPGQRLFVANGIVKERSLPNQPSGDGTVPYESLAWSKKWITPDGPVIKHYEFEGVPHRETLSYPNVVSLVAEILCGGVPVEVHATDNDVETIFSKSPEFILEHLSDENKVPFLVSCVLKSLYAKNAISFKGLGCDINTTAPEEDLKRLGALFASWQKSECDELLNVHPKSLCDLLKKFLADLGSPLIAIEGNNLWARSKIMLASGSPTEVVIPVLRRLVDQSPFGATAIVILRFLHDLNVNTANGIEQASIVEHFLPFFFWSLRSNLDYSSTIFELMLTNIDLLVPWEKTCTSTNKL